VIMVTYFTRMFEHSQSFGDIRVQGSAHGAAVYHIGYGQGTPRAPLHSTKIKTRHEVVCGFLRWTTTLRVPVYDFRSLVIEGTDPHHR
jgi:hypothetical protein